MFKVVFAKLQPVPDSFVFLRKTIGSGPGHVLFRHRTAYFRWNLGDSRWNLGDFRWILGGN